ncbi:chloride channel protein [[Phormidium] sp. ETS-05]|uniref:chloride channel protein n=1 Tax=[Phormidium] sp. ETS-05 TaxID=222819 RepID=UPI0018EEF4AA|nr:chloride channel protein [[Phormidium] sp. ETS-05]
MKRTQGRFFPRISVSGLANARTLQPKRLAIVEACLIGLIAGLAAVLLKQGGGTLGTWRIYGAQHGLTWLWLPAVGLVGGFLAGAIVEQWAPVASGSGIPHVKAVLAGVNSPLDGRVAVVKLLGSMVAIGSGITLGRQGPTVQIGAAVAAQLSRWVPTSPEYRRQLIASGAAAGLAAGFNAPIAGVLFVVEELIHDWSSITLAPAIVASFVGASVSRILGGFSLNLNQELINPAITANTTFSAPEIPFYVFLGLLAGFFGACLQISVVRAATIAQQLNRGLLHLSLPMRAGLAGLICGLVVGMLPPDFRNNSGLRDFLLAGKAAPEISAMAFITHFGLTVLAAGSGAPGGLFAPSLVLGSSLGYLVGHTAQQLAGVGDPVTFAFAGMGAFFCAVSRTPITGVVIIFEISTNFNLVLPLMIGSVVSYLISEKVCPGSLYDQLLELNGIELKKERTAGAFLQDMTAADVMQREVETLPVFLTLEETLAYFTNSHHQGFPVVDGGFLVGIVTNGDLNNAVRQGLPGNTPLKEIMTPSPVTVQARDSLAEVLYSINRLKIGRIPVMEQRLMVGIITRSDIIRAESEYLSGERAGMREHSYVVYQTQAPQIGKGRLLVPLANPQTAPLLLKLALAIARDKNYEVECLQVLLVPRGTPTDQTPVQTTKARRLLQKAVRMGEAAQVPVHTQVRVAHDVAQAILETIKTSHIKTTLMGWKGGTSTPGRIFGDVTDRVLRQSAGDVILVKWGEEEEYEGMAGREDSKMETPTYCPIPLFNRWLVPVAGGPNSQAALGLLPALVTLGVKPQIRLIHILPHADVSAHKQTVVADAKDLLAELVSCPIYTTSIHADSVPEVVIDVADRLDYDVVMVGASREGLLQQAINGNIPESIARGCRCTVILVRFQ